VPPERRDRLWQEIVDKAEQGQLTPTIDRIYIICSRCDFELEFWFVGCNESEAEQHVCVILRDSAPSIAHVGVGQCAWGWGYPGSIATVAKSRGGQMVNDQVLLSVAKAMQWTYSKATSPAEPRTWEALADDEQRLWIRMAHEAANKLAEGAPESPTERTEPPCVSEAQPVSTKADGNSTASGKVAQTVAAEPVPAVGTPTPPLQEKTSKGHSWTELILRPRRKASETDSNATMQPISGPG
jgi:hypothetical protein